MTAAQYDIQSLDADRLEPAFDLATCVFATQSTLHQALGVDLKTYRDDLRPSFTAMVSEELSVVASDATGQTKACLIATRYDPQSLLSAPQTPPIKALSAALAQQYLARHSIHKGKAVLIDMAAVAQDAMGKGLYQAMRNKAHRIAYRAGFNRVLGELSSTATQHVVLNRLDHAKVAEVRFKEFRHNGAYPFADISEPKSIVLSEGNLADA